MARNTQNIRAPITFEQADLNDPSEQIGYDGDVEQAWEKWGEALHQSENPGTVKVAKLPLDEKGAPMVNVKGQIQLGAYPFDQYTFEELLDKVRSEFMKPGETIAVRLTGTSAGQVGVKFNRVVMVQRQSGHSENNSQLGEVLNAMQVAQQNQAQMLERILQPRGDAVRIDQSQNNQNNLVDSLVKLSPLLSPIIGALLSKIIAPAAPAAGGLNDMLSGLEKLMTLREMVSGGGNQNDESTTLGIIKAVAPQGLGLLTELVKNQAAQASPRQLSAPRLQNVAQIGNATNAMAPHSDAFSMPQSHDAARPPQSAPASIPEQSNTPETDTMLAQIGPQIEQLALLAENGTPPAEAAKLMLDLIPSGDEGIAIDDAIYNLVSNAERFGRLKYLSAKFAKHAVWFEELRVVLLKEFEDDSTAPANVN